MKIVTLLAIVRMVHVIGVAKMDGVVEKDFLEMDVMAPLVGQSIMNVY